MAALPSRDLIVAAHQQITHQWWHEQRHRFELFVSELVVQEVRRGDPDAAQRRLGFLHGLSSLSGQEPVRYLAKEILRAGCLPETAQEDAVHIALASVHGMDYLLTWNCRHIANARTRQKVADCCRAHHFKATIISTPEELPEEDPHVA